MRLPAWERATRRAAVLAWIQGSYYFLTGVWPLVHGRSFQMVTGPKEDFWLAQTVGALLALIGWSLLRAAYRRAVTVQLADIAAGTAFVLMLADVLALQQPRSTWVYALDAAGEGVLVAAWLRLRARLS